VKFVSGLLSAGNQLCKFIVVFIQPFGSSANHQQETPAAKETFQQELSCSETTTILGAQQLPPDRGLIWWIIRATEAGELRRKMPLR
jgi:hypothetical protein